MARFVVIHEQGPGWDPARAMREQPGWDDHARFMDSLAEEWFVVLGGPLRGGPRHRAIRVVEAADERTARERLAGDPWMRDGVLRSVSLEAWTVLLGTLP